MGTIALQAVALVVVLVPVPPEVEADVAPVVPVPLAPVVALPVVPVPAAVVAPAVVLPAVRLPVVLLPVVPPMPTPVVPALVELPEIVPVSLLVPEPVTVPVTEPDELPVDGPEVEEPVAESEDVPELALVVSPVPMLALVPPALVPVARPVLLAALPDVLADVRTEALVLLPLAVRSVPVLVPDPTSDPLVPVLVSAFVELLQAASASAPTKRIRSEN